MSLLVRILLVTTICLAGWDMATAQQTGRQMWERITLNTAPEALTQSGTVSLGRLTYAGGLSLSSRDSRFGGLSDLVVSPDGTRVLSVSDRGTWVSFRLHLDARRELIAANDLSMTAVRDEEGQPLDGDASDSESLAVLPDGRVAVGFERWTRVWLYDLDSALAAKAVPGPTFEDGERLEPNRGLEALATTPQGGLLAGSERGFIGAGRAPLYFANPRGDGSWPADVLPRGFLQLAPSYGLTELATLADGRYLALVRSYVPLFGTRVELLVLPPTPGARTPSIRLARFESRGLAFNFEGVGVDESQPGKTRIYLLTDDNFQPDQRTLLMAFDWDGKTGNAR
jgi:hypothetical protein